MSSVTKTKQNKTKAYYEILKGKKHPEGDAKILEKSHDFNYHLCADYS